MTANDSFLYWATHTPDGIACVGVLAVIGFVMLDALFNWLWAL